MGVSSDKTTDFKATNPGEHKRLMEEGDPAIHAGVVTNAPDGIAGFGIRETDLNQQEEYVGKEENA